MLELFEWKDMGDLPPFQLEVPKKKNIPDFLYYMMHPLYVSEKVIRVLERFKICDIRFYPFSLTYYGKKIDTYYWINFLKEYDILDRKLSKYEIVIGDTELRAECFNKIYKFIPDQAKVPENKLFRIYPGNIKIFKEELALAILQAKLTGALFIPVEEYTKLL